MSIIVSEFIQHYFIAIIACIGLALFLYANRIVSKKVLRVFSFTVFVIVLVIISETGDRITARDVNAVFWRKIWATTAYISRVGVVYCIMYIPARNWHVKHKLLNSIPFLINAILLILSFNTGIVFSIDSENSFSRGPLGILPFITSAFYLLELVVSSYINFKRKEYQEGVICTFVMGFCITAVVLESLYDMYGLLPSISIISLAFYYTNFVVSSYSRDQLTDTYLRSKFYDDIKTIKQPTYVISVDLNGLKQANDTKGHLAGDKMLRQFALAAISTVKSHARVYRTGGDEFVILYRTQNEEKIISALQEIKEKLEGTGVSFAAGYDLCLNSKEFTQSFSAADGKMYIDKAEYHLDLK